jgi:hypothetical protein
LLVTLTGIVVILFHSQTPFESVKTPASTLLCLDNSRIASQEYHGNAILRRRIMEKNRCGFDKSILRMESTRILIQSIK